MLGDTVWSEQMDRIFQTTSRAAMVKYTPTTKDYYLSRSWAVTTLRSVTDDSVAWLDQMCIP